MERIRDYAHIAGANLLATPLRSLLSVLGIVVGTASVISVLALGAGARKDLLDSITRSGTEIFRVRAEYDMRSDGSGELTIDHLRALRAAPFVEAAFADIREFANVRSRYEPARAILSAVDVGYLRLNDLQLAAGRDLNPVDDEDRRLVCLVSADRLNTLFPAGTNPIGEEIFALKTRWEVVGTFQRAVPELVKDESQPVEILVPLSSYLRHATQTSIREIVVHVKLTQAAGAKDMLTELITHGEPAKKKLFTVAADRERIAQRLENRRLLFVLWTAIACISLLVGGMGMMNVMLTSVAERTREIGLRRAIGARRKDILIQFLVESCILSVIGGTIGLFVGAAVARALPKVLVDFGIRLAVMEPSFAIGTVFVSVVMGVVFGLYPAIRAAGFSPAEALRSDG